MFNTNKEINKNMGVSLHSETENAFHCLTVHFPDLSHDRRRPPHSLVVCGRGGAGWSPRQSRVPRPRWVCNQQRDSLFH